MRNALIKKVLLFSVLLVVVTSDVYSQYTKRIRVPYRSQATSNWCWAASMKMIMDFHNPLDSCNASQCHLAKQLFKFATGSDLSGVSCCVDCGGSCSSLGTSCAYAGLETLAIGYTYDGTVALPDNFDLIFSYGGYSSTQKINNPIDPMSWEEVKYQIDNCRPFIINIDPAPKASGGLDTNHALVVNGYQEDSLHNRFVLTLDPWRVCGGLNESLFPIEIFSRTDTVGVTGEEGGTYLVNSVLSTVHTIYPDTLFTDVSNCASCEALEKKVYPGEIFIEERRPTPDTTIISGDSLRSFSIRQFQGKGNPTEPETTSKLLKFLEEQPTKIVGYKKTAIDTSTYNKFLRQKGYYDAPVEYISLNLVNRRYFLSCLFPPKKLSKVVLKNYEVYDIVSADVDKNLVSTMQKGSDGLLHLRKIYTQTYLKDTLVVRRENSERPIVLSNQKNSDTIANGSKPYSLVKYYPFQYEFFSFKESNNSNKILMSPAEDYPELSLFKTQVYTEGRVIKSLRGNTRDYVGFIRNLYQLIQEKLATNINMTRGRDRITLQNK